MSVIGKRYEELQECEREGIDPLTLRELQENPEARIRGVNTSWRKGGKTTYIVR